MLAFFYFLFDSLLRLRPILLVCLLALVTYLSQTLSSLALISNLSLLELAFVSAPSLACFLAHMLIFLCTHFSPSPRLVHSYLNFFLSVALDFSLVRFLFRSLFP